MKAVKCFQRSATKVILCTLACSLCLSVTTPAQTTVVKNVVIVHGAFADASGWQQVYAELTKHGYAVTLVQNPCTSLKADVEATNVALDKMSGPVILVGHSWGGTVITEAGLHERVAALVYVNGFQPEVGENTVKLASSAPAKPENGLLPPDEKGNIFYDEAKFHAGFCADVSQETADFMYASSGYIPAAAFETPVTQAAWKSKPTFGISSNGDKSINPIITLSGYKRSHSIVTQIDGSHVVFMTHPKEVAAVIMEAAKTVSK
ncbi:alpha/beta hydrolase [Flavitalea sp. BT771]|uniref:alpha/beta hydrolase n=1 Tax=Flavitalea sp. BT771 TaxID=3063329 RepID=UPI0026E4573B|nr:alpha/beta hydrolase [Flavitalea sp. BT771]MDO6431150.1 alpha/beta hydrolase [Flavitalea sp. BT771]MDV6220057.1 alpha/beta hydrolase [Flavitalea sp. BT771]